MLLAGGRRQSAPTATGHRTTYLAFVLASATALLVALLEGPKFFYYDSGGYWLLGHLYFGTGNFSLLNFANPIRGYLLPLIDHFLQVGDGVLGWSASSMVGVIDALLFASIGAVFAPKLAEMCWPRIRWGTGRRVLGAVLMLIFWHGYLPFPLSDFPALAAALLAIVAIGNPESPWWMLVAGLACGAAFEIRPAYELLVPSLVVLFAWATIERRKGEHASTPHRVACFALLLAGLAAFAIPQSLAAHRHFGTWSPVPGAAANLTGLQLTEGLQLQEYDTYVGPGHSPQMRYVDPEGSQLLAELPGHMVSNLHRYAEIFVSHPLTITKVFFRHVINGLDVRYSTLYVAKLDTGSHKWMRLAGFLITFLALLRVLWPEARRRLGEARWRYMGALVVCCIPAIPSAMETRYLLPIYIASYVLVLLPSWPNPIRPASEGGRRYRTVAIIAAAYLVFMLVVLHTIGDASKTLHFTGAV
jgi:hypothetical protein